MKVHYCNQRSAEWFALRHGCVTASRAADVMAFKSTGDKGERAERINYRAELVMELLTGVQAEHYKSDDMQRGIDFEDEARTAYEKATGEMVELAGFIEHETIAKYGSSPDGILSGNRGIQIKVPRITTYIKWVRAGVVPDEHLWQMYAEMDCCEWISNDFIAYCPEMPKNARLFVRRLLRDENKIEALREGVVKFHAHLEAEIVAIEKEFGPLKRPKPIAPKEDYGELGITDEDFAALIDQRSVKESV